MALFIHPQNQTILWEKITHHPHISHMSHHEKMAWFRGQIEHIYLNMPKHIQEAPWTKEDLVQWNRKAIQWMVYQSDMARSGNNTVYHDRKSGTDIIESRLKEKQQDLDQMLHKPAPEPIDFKLCDVDEPIANMEELVKQQLREREMILLGSNEVGAGPSVAGPTVAGPSVAGPNDNMPPRTPSKHVSFVETPEPLALDVSILEPEPVNIVLTKEESMESMESVPPPSPIPTSNAALETSIDALRRELATMKQQLQWCLEFPGIKRWLDAKNAK
jgi:hypothetical protein